MGEMKTGVEVPKLDDQETFEDFRNVVELLDGTTDHPQIKRGSLLALASLISQPNMVTTSKNIFFKRLGLQSL